MNALKKLALLALFAVSGCSTLEVVPVMPHCAPVTVPALPVLDQGVLWDALGDVRYRQLERYINGLWSVIDEQAAVIDGVCVH